MRALFNNVPALSIAVALTLLGVSCVPSARVTEEPSPLGVVKPEDASHEGERLLRDVARAATGSGAGHLKVLAFSAGTPGDRIDGLVHIPAGLCGLFVARATPSVEDLDLHVYGDDGSQFGVDESPDDLPTLLLCPEADTRLYASARVAQGHGLVALGVQTVPQARSTSVAQAVGARNFARTAEEANEDWPGLEDALAERRRVLGGRWVDQRRVALPVDARVPTHLTVDVPKGRCLDAVLLPTDDVSQVQVAASDRHGRVFARGLSLGTMRSLLLCSAKQAESVTLIVRPYAGRGLAVAALSVSKTPYEGLDPAPGVEPHFVDQSAPALDHAQLPPPQTTRTFALRRGQISSWESRLGGCARMDLLPDAQLSGYEVRVWSEKGDLLAEGRGQRGLPLFVCAHGTVRVDLEAVGRSGSLTAELRSSTKSLPRLMDLPLAASRLLDRGHREGLVSSPEDIGRVTPIEVSDTKLLRVPLSIPASHCQTLLVAGDHGTVGLSARVIDSQTGLDLDRALGRSSLVAQACAPRGAHLQATLELRTTSGNARALWAFRQTKLSR